MRGDTSPARIKEDSRSTAEGAVRCGRKAGRFLLPRPDPAISAWQKQLQGLVVTTFRFPGNPPELTLPCDGQVIEHDGHQYTLGSQIGEGAFGHVFECADEWDNKLVAKVLVPRNQTYEQVRESWNRELGNLLLLRHPNITYVHAAFEYRHTFYIVVERCDLTLKSFIGYSGIEAWIPRIARDILHGLQPQFTTETSSTKICTPTISW